MQPKFPSSATLPAGRLTRQSRQLDIQFEGGGTRLRRAGASDRKARARWWFNRMRQVVNQALDWTPAPAPRPEQIRLALTR